VPCAKGMPTRKGDEPFSGCRVDCLHRKAIVLEYRPMRQASVEAAERAAGSPTHHPTEWREYVAAHPLFTLRQFLEGRRDDRERPDQ